MKVGFFGHRDTYLNKEKLDKLEKLIVDVISKNKQVEFFLGGYGNFDYYCAKILLQLKTEYSNFKLTFITPYLNTNHLKEVIENNLYDDYIYPPLENTPKKYAIIKRNFWIVDNCDFLIFNVKHSYGGAYRAFKYAKQKDKEFINFN